MVSLPSRHTSEGGLPSLPGPRALLDTLWARCLALSSTFIASSHETTISLKDHSPGARSFSYYWSVWKYEWKFIQWTTGPGEGKRLGRPINSWIKGTRRVPALLGI